MNQRKRVTPKQQRSGKRTSHEKYKDPGRRRTQRIIAIVLIIGLVGSLVTGTALLLLVGDDDEAADVDITTTTAAPVEPCPSAEMPPVREPPAPREPVQAPIDPAKTYVATLETTCGTMIFELLPESAGPDVANFVGLANEGFYNDTIFHRIVEDFVIQGGDPLGPDPARAGTGNPGYTYTGTTPEATPGRPVYEVGDLAMANSSDPSTNGSQFFIVSGPNGTQLPANFSLFGEMQDGFEVLDRIQNTPTSAQGQNEGYPDIPVVITSLTIAET